MLKVASVAVALFATTALSLASAMSGTMTWVSGKLTSALTITATPETVELTVGTTSTSYADTIVPGQPGSTLPAGTPFAILERGSIPFAGTFPASEDAHLIAVPTLPTYNRAIPVSTAGALADGIGEPLITTPTSLSLWIPDCTVGTIDFLNGLGLLLPVGMPNYSITLPTGGAAVFSKVTFPTGSAGTNTVAFTGFGNGELTFAGLGFGTSINVVGGNIIGTPTELSTASLAFEAGLGL